MREIFRDAVHGLMGTSYLLNHRELLTRRSRMYPPTYLQSSAVVVVIIFGIDIYVLNIELRRQSASDKYDSARS